jgi:quercetin dioxygenase-like cupin family protein
MAEKYPKPSKIQAAGNKPKIIEEFIGRVNSRDKQVSIARMTSPAGWREPGQTPKFDEYTIVLNGILTVKTREHTFTVSSGEAIKLGKGEWVQYSTPADTEYISVCLPAFTPDTVHRDQE